MGGMAFASVAATRVWGQDETGTPAERTIPADPLALSSARLRVLLDRQDGVPVQYELPSGRRMRGELPGRQIAATVCNPDHWIFATASIAASSVKSSPTQADFLFDVSMDGKPAARFTVRYRIAGPTVYVTLEDVREEKEFQLIEVKLPNLATVREEDGDAWLAHGDNGGNLAKLSEAKEGALPPNAFWGNALTSLPVVMIGTEQLLCVQETTAYMDYTLLSVTEGKGRLRAALGTIQRHRVNGSLCYDMNTGKGTPRNCGNRSTPNLLIGQKPSCRLDFLVPSEGKTSVDWLDGARLVRSRMPQMPSRYYDGKFIYGIRCDEPRFPKPAATFEQCAQIIQEIETLTDHSPQIAHLWGWQYRGKDTGYPAAAEVNSRLGGFEALEHLLAEGPQHGCRVTFSDNYDDAYRSSPAWDPHIIARRPDGELWESRNWTGEDSYVLGLAKYMAGPGPERVRYTCQRYGLKDTIHVDVLSYFTIRNDWDRERPASGLKNLVEGRYRVLDDFKKYGLDVTSEAMRYAMIGKISFFWHIASARPCPFGGKAIPLQPMIYRKSASWGEGGDHGDLAHRVMSTLFYNGCMHLILRNDTDRKEIADLFYLNLLPWFKVKNRNIESFHRDGNRTVIGLEGNSRIDQNWDAQEYSVVVDGVEIARDLSTFCPMDQNRIAFYSVVERELSAPVPPSWAAEKVSAAALSTEKSEPFPIRVSGGRIRVNVPARAPVIVYGNRASAQQTVRPNR
jgi:Endo-alpha-N-acetylgalactosaminidase